MRRTRDITAPALALLLALLLALPGARAVSQTIVDPMLRIARYADGFTSPGFFEFLPGPQPGPIEFLVGEIGTGRVLHYRDGALVGVALDLPVALLFERGLLGIALHPDFESNPYVYLYYTASATGLDNPDLDGALENRVARFTWNGSTLGSEQRLLGLPVGPNHNGGALVFGPDSLLYGSIGEAGSTGSQMQNVVGGPPPNHTSMIFRIGDDGGVPADNPFLALGGNMERVYMYGGRNVFGLDFDPVSKVLWDTDNGAATYDEVNRVLPGTNGGWKQIMGPSARDAAGLDSLWQAAGSTYVDPAFSFFQSFGITALHFQRGGGLGENYDGDLFIAAHNSMTIYHFEVATDRASLVMPDATVSDLVADTSAERDLFLWASGVGVITDMETGPDGALYVLRFSTPPQIYRISRARTSDAAPWRDSTRLHVAPNPFRDQATLRLLDGELGSSAALHVYTAAGRMVRILRPQGAGLDWDGRDGRGAPVPAGVYLLRLAEPGRLEQQCAKLVRVE